MEYHNGPPHLATKNNERFSVDRRGEPAVVIMSVQDFIRRRTAARLPAESLDWREAARARKLTPADIDAEIHAYQRKPDL
jgi:hypothetical protein